MEPIVVHLAELHKQAVVVRAEERERGESSEYEERVMIKGKAKSKERGIFIFPLFSSQKRTDLADDIVDILGVDELEVLDGRHRHTPMEVQPVVAVLEHLYKKGRERHAMNGDEGRKEGRKEGRREGGRRKGGTK